MGSTGRQAGTVGTQYDRPELEVDIWPELRLPALPALSALSALPVQLQKVFYSRSLCVCWCTVRVFMTLTELRATVKIVIYYINNKKHKFHEKQVTTFAAKQNKRAKIIKKKEIKTKHCATLTHTHMHSLAAHMVNK